MRELPKITSGVYLIRFSDTHYYGGRSSDIEKRWRKHLQQLERGVHGNHRMQTVFDQTRLFEPALVQECRDAQQQKEFEQHWLDEHFGREGCLNLSASAVSGQVKGFHHSEETKRRMSETRKGRPGHIPTEEARQRMSEAGKKRAPPSEETRQKLRSYRHTEDTKARMAVSHTGMVFTEDHKKNMSVHHVGTKGKKLPPRAGKETEETKRKRQETWQRKRLQENSLDD